MEECVGELGNMAHHKRALTRWRGGRGRSGSVSLETWHVTNEHSLGGGEGGGGEGWRSWKRGNHQKRTHLVEGRKGEGRGGELGNGASDKQALTWLRVGKR